MYRKHHNGQLTIEEFHVPFGGKLDSDNRWVIFSSLMPWEELEQTYAPQFSPTTGAPAKPVRLAFGALFIKQRLGLTDEETVEQIRENAYMQFFLGFAGYSSKAPFDPSMMVHFRKRFSEEDLNRINELIAERGKALVLEAVASLPDDVSDDPDADSGEQISLDDFMKPADWPADKNWGTLTIDASCTPADITYPTDLKLLNEARDSTERIIDDLCIQHSDFRKYKPRYDRGRARAVFLNVAKQKKPRRRKIKAAIRRQLDYLQRNLDAIDALIASGAGLSGLKTHWWQKLLVISELHRQQSILLYSKTRSMPDRIVNLVQRHVRPIVRGKARAAVEFGAKISVSVRNSFAFLHRISWDPYNEAVDLIPQAKKYKQEYGCYPERICADRIYINTKNRNFCTRNDIRLSGKRLGRPPARRQLGRRAHCIFKAATRLRMLHQNWQPPMASARGDVQGLRSARAGSLKEGERIALALSAAAARYLSLSRTGKQLLLNELQALTGYHRKSLLRRLNQQPDQRQTSQRGQHRRRYGPEVVESLVPLWEASDRLCGKRLHALLPQLVESLEHHGHLQLEEGVRARVLTMSSATIDRLLAPVRLSSGGNGWRRPPRAHSGVRRRVQVRTFKGWDDHKQPGWLEIDLVAHCGGRLEGRFIWTLVATDIATGWSESLPVITRDGASVLAAIQRLRQQLPFPLRGIDADNDPAFMNALMEQWCDASEQGIELTRSRAYQSNDQAWVEQKNGMLIRRVVGYERLVGLEAAQLLAELYAALRLFTNLFQPSFKLKSSVREGGRIKRHHHPPRTPLQQLLRTGVLGDQEAQGLRKLRKRCDPVALLATMRSCQSRLALLISGQRASAMAGDPLSWQTPEEEKRELEGFLQGLQALWRQSRPLQKKPKPRQGRRSRVDPFEAHADLVPQWLEAEADVGSQELLERLIALDPERYGPQHKRTLQRRIRDWRVARVQECLESAAVRPETKPGRREKVLPGVN